MVTVPIKDEYVEVLKTLGDLQKATDIALQRYTVEQIITKITELRRKDATYQIKYGTDYPTFARRTAEDETFVNYLETNLNKMWEVDLADWEFCHKGVEDWIRKLQTILLT